MRLADISEGKNDEQVRLFCSMNEIRYGLVNRYQIIASLDSPIRDWTFSTANQTLWVILWSHSVACFQLALQ